MDNTKFYMVCFALTEIVALLTVVFVSARRNSQTKS